MTEGTKPELLIDLVTKTMPYGKYRGVLFYKLPVYYLEWFHRKGFPKDKTGQLLETLFEIKLKGLDYLLEKIKSEIS